MFVWLLAAAHVVWLRKHIDCFVAVVVVVVVAVAVGVAFAVAAAVAAAADV